MSKQVDYNARSTAAFAAALASWALAEHAHGLDSTAFNIFGWIWFAISCIHLIGPRIPRVSPGAKVVQHKLLLRHRLSNAIPITIRRRFWTD